MRDPSHAILIPLLAALLMSSCYAGCKWQVDSPRARMAHANTMEPMASLSADPAGSGPTDMTTTPGTGDGFYVVLQRVLAAQGRTLDQVCNSRDVVAKRLLADYGALFVAEGITVPPVCMFTTEAETRQFQNSIATQTEIVSGTKIQLQAAAMRALLAARADASNVGLNITPRGGSEGAARSYTDTRRLWDSRVNPALDHWRQLGKLSQAEVASVRALPVRQQVERVLALEQNGIFFSKDFSKSILYSVAAPGASQHIFMLAFDVTEFADQRIRKLLAAHGWFQTVRSDLPHFTYLGVAESRLPALGLRKVSSGGQDFWIPNVSD